MVLTVDRYDLDLIPSGVHKTTTEVKVIIIAVENQILLRFDNPTSEVDKYEDEVGKKSYFFLQSSRNQMALSYF